MKELKLGSLFDGSGGARWKPVRGYESEYMVSDDGRIYSIRKNMTLKPLKQKTGYMRVHLSKCGVAKCASIHRLVAEAFVPNEQGKPTVNHINEIKSDNRAENLEWMTNAEQNAHGTRTKRAATNTNYKNRKIDYAAVARKHNYKLMNASMQRPIARLDKDGRELARYKGVGEASRETGVNIGHICDCANGKRKTSGGFRWEYIS